MSPRTALAPVVCLDDYRTPEDFRGVLERRGPVLVCLTQELEEKNIVNKPTGELAIEARSLADRLKALLNRLI